MELRLTSAKRTWCDQNQGLLQHMAKECPVCGRSSLGGGAGSNYSFYIIDSIHQSMTLSQYDGEARYFQSIVENEHYAKKVAMQVPEGMAAFATYHE